MELLSKELVTDEYREQLKKDLERATVCRFLVAYVSTDGLHAITRPALIGPLRDPRSFGVASLSCACGYDPLVKLQSELGANVGVRLKYFMDPMVKDTDEPINISLFHSKLVYLHLEKEQKSVVYLGSHNWSRRALGPTGTRNAEVSVRFEFPFEPEHLDGAGNSIPSEVNQHLLQAWNAPLCYPATRDQEPRFQEWMQRGCHKAPAAPVKEVTVILAVLKQVSQMPSPTDWLSLEDAGIYMQALDEEEGRQVWDANDRILVLVWRSDAALTAGQQPFILKCRKTASNAGPVSAVAGNNQADSPMEGFKAVLFDEAKLLAAQKKLRGERPGVKLWSGRNVRAFDFEFPTTRTESSQVDAGIKPLYQFYLQTEAVIFPADNATPPRARYAWERETFAVAESKDAARMEEAPGYFAPPELKERIIHFLRETLHVDPMEARVLPYSEPDAKVGKRLSRHPLQDTYIGSDFRGKPTEFYNKSEQGMLVPEIDAPLDVTTKSRRKEQAEFPLPRVQRVFTMPLKDLFTLWSDTAVRIRSEGSSDHH